MKIIQQFIADDGMEFSTEADCLAYEAMFPFMKLLNDVEVAAKTNAVFARKIEALGTKLARDRVARGESLRPGRKAKIEPALEITGAAASADRRESAEDFGHLQPMET